MKRRCFNEYGDETLKYITAKKNENAKTYFDAVSITDINDHMCRGLQWKQLDGSKHGASVANDLKQVPTIYSKSNSALHLRYYCILMMCPISKVKSRIGHLTRMVGH